MRRLLSSSLIGGLWCKRVINEIDYDLESYYKSYVSYSKKADEKWKDTG